jgi:hypothetical protein
LATAIGSYTLLGIETMSKLEVTTFEVLRDGAMGVYNTTLLSTAVASIGVFFSDEGRKYLSRHMNEQHRKEDAQ